MSFFFLHLTTTLNLFEFERSRQKLAIEFLNRFIFYMKYLFPREYLIKDSCWGQVENTHPQVKVKVNFTQETKKSFTGPL